MNMNSLIDEIKKKIGLVGHLSSAINDYSIRDIIYMSLEEFNRYSSTEIRLPLRYFSQQILSYNIDMWTSPHMIEVPIADEIVQMCDEAGSTIKQIHLHRVQTTPYTTLSQSMKQDMVMVGSAYRQSLNSKKPTIRVRPPNVLIVENYVPDMVYYQAYEMRLQVTHPKSLATITKGLERWFVDLCQRNVEIVLYNNDLRFLNIDIGSIRVELNIENFQSAESEKRTLLEEMRLRASADQAFISY